MKPSNILLDHDGEPHVADFSLAKRLDHEGDLTHTGEVLGTPAFMAREVAFHGGAEAGVPSDIYSLGAMLYQLITGRPPHHGGTTLETIRHTADEEVKVPSTLNASVNRDLSTVALKCLERDPARRYVTALEIAEDLQRFIRDEPIRARAITPVERLQRWSRRHPMRVAVVFIFLSLLVAGVTAVTWQWRRALRANNSLTQSNQRLNSELRAATALRLASQARSELGQSGPRGLLLAAESVEMTRRVDGSVLPGAYNALIETVAEVGGELVLAPDKPTMAPVISPDGRWLAAAKFDGMIRLRDLHADGRGESFRVARIRRRRAAAAGSMRQPWFRRAWGKRSPCGRSARTNCAPSSASP